MAHSARVLRVIALVVLVAASGSAALAQGLSQSPSQQNKDQGRYIPGIWIDPDGCEHWVMDDGSEGFMTPHVTRDGKPVCRSVNLCGNLNADQMFDSGSATLSARGQEDLQVFFQSTFARSFIVAGHTDARASDAYNIRLSRERARAVARIGQSVGARINEVRAYGERRPRASNATPEGRAQNRRVEIICIR